MRYTSILVQAFAAFSHIVSAQTLVGAAEGFAKGVTGGGKATPVYPANIDQLKTYLTDKNPRVIVLNKVFDFTTSEGTESGTACATWGTGASCQKIIQSSCGSVPTVKGTWYKAARTPIDVASDKTILGVGTSGVIKGKGLRFRGGAKNIIVQNIAVTDLNPEYVWGGDAISFDGSDLIWIDHVTTARPGRQHYVFGYNPSTRITLSNNHIDGKSPFSTGCGDGYHYWTFEMVGKGDQITMKGNYITRTAGRSPALSGSTLLHAVNNVWHDNNGHAIEGGETTARGIFEGNVFTNVKALSSDYKGRMFAASSANNNCNAAFKRVCQANTFYNSQGALPPQDTSFFSDFAGLNIASAQSAASARANVPNNAGIGKL